jgi:hypothetical protein
MPDQNQLLQQMQQVGNVTPMELQQQAKSYYAPIMGSLAQEGGDFFKDYFSSFSNALPSIKGDAAGLSVGSQMQDALQRMGNAGGLYEANRGMRDYWGTRADDLFKTANDSVNTQYSRLNNMYNITSEQNRWQQEMDFKKQQAAQAAARAAQQDGNTYGKTLTELLNKLKADQQHQGDAIGAASAGLLSTGKPGKTAYVPKSGVSVGGRF